MAPGDFVDPPAGLLGEKLEGGPTSEHIGQVLVRVLADSVLIARVVNVAPRGNDGYVRLSDGTVRGINLGCWYRLNEAL